MNRSLSIRRLYSLGETNFKNISFSDDVSDLPQTISLNPEVTGKITYLQLLNIEEGFRRYLLLAKKLGASNPEEELKLLEEIRTKTMLELKELLNGHLDK